MHEYTIRRAIMGDVKAVHKLLMGSATKGQLLPRALIHLYRHIRDFYVAETVTGDIVACSALAPIWEELGEICSLVVADEYQRQGMGRKMVNACIKDAKPLGLTTIFSLTYQEEFFISLGFYVVDRDILPQKIWADCVHCPKYPDCDETAVLLNLPK